MITATNIYLWGILGRVEVVLVISVIITGITSLFVTMAWLFEGFDDENRVRFKMYAAFALSLLLTVVVPTRETFAAMYVLPAIAKSEAVQKDLPEVYNMAVDFMKKQLTKETK